MALIIALAFVDGTLAFVARSVTRVTAATTSSPRNLMPEGKAAFNVALAVATVAGPVLGGAALTFLGPATALIADGVSFLIAGLIIACAAGLRAPTGSDPSGEKRARELRASFRYIAGNATLRVLIFGEGIAFIFFYLVVPVTVIYVSRSLHAGPAGYAAILGSWGAGAVIGSTVHVRLARRVRPRDNPHLDRRRRRRVPRHGARANLARRVPRERARRSWQRHPVGVGRDRRAPACRGALPGFGWRPCSSRWPRWHQGSG